jgi:hypothetical protein
MRSDVRYRPLDDPYATSPIILSHRIHDQSEHIALVKRLIEELYAENPPWLD